MTDLAPHHLLTTRARALLEIAGPWIMRAETKPPPLVTDDEKLTARARFDEALVLVRMVAKREIVYAWNLALPPWPVVDDPRVIAINEIREFARVAPDDLDSLTRRFAEEEDRGLQLLTAWGRDPAPRRCLDPSAPLGCAMGPTADGVLDRVPMSCAYSGRACRCTGVHVRSQPSTLEDITGSIPAHMRVISNSRPLDPRERRQRSRKDDAHARARDKRAEAVLARQAEAEMETTCC